MSSPGNDASRGLSVSKFFQILTRLEGLLIAVVLLAIIVLTIVQMASRRLPLDIVWTDEVIRFLLVWLVFMGAAYSFGNGKILALELMAKKLSPLTNRIINATAIALSILVCGYITYQGGAFLGSVSGQTSVTGGIPMTYVYLSVLVGFALMTAHLAHNLFLITSGRGEKH